MFVCWLEMTFGIQVHSCDEASAKSENHQLVRHYFCTIYSPVIEFDKKLPIKLNRSFGINFELVEIVSLDKSTTCYLKCHQLLELLLIFSSCYIVRSRHTQGSKRCQIYLHQGIGAANVMIVLMFSLLTDLDSKDSKCWISSRKEEEIFENCFTSPFV